MLHARKGLKQNQASDKKDAVHEFLMIWSLLKDDSDRDLKADFSSLRRVPRQAFPRDLMTSQSTNHTR